MDEKRLSDEVYNKITALCAEGDKLSAQQAIAKYTEALALLDEPETWVISSYMYAGIGDSLMKQGDYVGALDYFYLAYAFEENVTNPYILLNLGICQHHLSETEHARNFLLSAYMLGGEEVFADDEQYLEVIEDLI